jgi:ABC-type Na+ efflux pump permease subunit
MLAIMNRRLFVTLFAIILVALFSNLFVQQLALIDGANMGSALQAEILRYSLIFLMLLTIVSSIAEDYEAKQFERLLSMPLSRWQYIAAQFLVIVSLSGILLVAIILSMLLTSAIGPAVYWGLAVWFELVMVGSIALLAGLSLEKVPAGVMLAISLYLLSRLAPLIDQMLVQSIELSESSLSTLFVEKLFNAITFILPGEQSFAVNNVFFNSVDIASALLAQSQQSLIYSFFIISAVMIDFYRKEFNL